MQEQAQKGIEMNKSYSKKTLLTLLLVLLISSVAILRGTPLVSADTSNEDFVIGGIGGQVVNGDPVGFSGEELSHGLARVVFGPVLYEDNVFSGF